MDNAESLVEWDDRMLNYLDHITPFERGAPADNPFIAVVLYTDGEMLPFFETDPTLVVAEAISVSTHDGVHSVQVHAGRDAEVPSFAMYAGVMYRIP